MESYGVISTTCGAIVLAFVFGAVARQFRLSPILGYPSSARLKHGGGETASHLDFAGRGFNIHCMKRALSLRAMYGRREQSRA